MQALIVVGNPGAASFSHAMAAAAGDILRERGYTVFAHDLYAERFNPVQPMGEFGNTSSTDTLVEQHCAELAAADIIVVAHPNWWGQPPAIMKGWIDRVIRLNTAYAYPAGVGAQGVPVGLLRAKCAVVLNTSNTPAEREASAFGDPLDLIWLRCIFPLCGVKQVERRMFGPIAGSTIAQRAGWLDEVRELVAANT